MKVEIKEIGFESVKKASALLTENFVDDKGVIALFKRNDNYVSKVSLWFSATLIMLIINKQFINGAYIDNKLVGISVVTHNTFKPSTLSILRWTLSVLFSCGLGTVMKSAKHDQHRKSSFSEKNQYILEFIAVNSIYRGKGIGRKLFSNLHDISRKTHSAVWLETTKENNIKIFEKLGYRLIDEKIENSVKHFIMMDKIEKLKTKKRLK